MTDQGPTTVGSIVAKLRMMREQWVADVAATKQEARELGNLSPDIHIDDNAAAVIGRMKATEAAVRTVGDRADKVTVAQGRLTAAMSAADSAYAKVTVAQLRLNETRDRADEGSARLAAAELSLSEAMKRLDAANDKVVKSELAVAAAHKAAAAAAGDQERATIKANEANKTTVTRIGAIATAVALLLPLLTPVAAAAIGIGSAMLGMGAAGILAIIGIKREMDAGTAVGEGYRTGLDSLKTSMNTLAQTSAVNMLSSFRRVAKETADALPDLNVQVGRFSGLLGRTGGNFFVGAINSLRILNPLFLTAGVYLESLSEGFQRWTEGSGIEEFGGYALSVFPQVVDVLGKLASTIMHILVALAPLGTIGIATLAGISTAISSIPVELLSQLIVTLTWGAVAFKAWGFIAPMLATIASSMGAVGVATTIATGPIGWVVAGLAALAGIFAVIIASNTGATQAMQDYTAAVQADSGAIGENIRQKTAQKLLDSGALDAAKQLKISVEDVTAATLGDAAAKKRVSAATDELNDKLGTYSQRKSTLGDADQKQSDALILLTGSMKENSNAITGEIDRYNTLVEAVGSATEVTRAQQAADEAVAGSIGTTAAALQAARGSQGDMEAATAKATAEMYLQGDAAGLLEQALDRLNGKALTAAEAQNQFESQLVRMPDYIDEVAGTYDEAGASIDGMSASAVDNRGALLGLIQSAQDSAQAYRDQGASSDEAKQKLIDSKQAIEDQAVANGMNRDSVHAYLEQLFRIPETVPKTKVEVDVETAKSQVDNFVANINSRFATIKVTTTAAPGDVGWGVLKPPGSANGSTARGLANGGGTVTGRGTAGSDSAGLYRLGNGEEVTSNVFGQADRNRALLKAINAGYTPSQVTAAPAQATPASSTAGPTIQVDVHVTVLKNEDPAVVGAQVGIGVKNALAGKKL